MLLIILMILIGIVAVVLVTALLMKKEYTIKSSITVNRQSAVVFDYVKHLRNQAYYSKWVMADPNAKMEYKGTDGTVGFISSWSSENKNVGVGAQEITKIEEGRRYDVEIRFEKPFKGVSKAHVTTEPTGENATQVTTTFEAKTPFPMNLLIPMLCKMLQKDMDENSANLKRVLEA